MTFLLLLSACFGSMSEQTLVESLFAVKQDDDLSGRFSPDIHVKRGDHAILVADSSREIAKLDDVDTRLA